MAIASLTWDVNKSNTELIHTQNELTKSNTELSNITAAFAKFQNFTTMAMANLTSDVNKANTELIHTQNDLTTLLSSMMVVNATIDAKVGTFNF